MSLDRLVKLEKRLATWFDRSVRGSGAPPDPIELVPMILDHVEEHVQATAEGGRTFPYDRVRIQVEVVADRVAAFRAVFSDTAVLEERVRARLREVGCAPPVALEVATRLVRSAAPEWGGLPFRIDYHARKSRPVESKTNGVVPTVRIAVLAGDAGMRNLTFELERINIGRMRRVSVAGGNARENHIAFADDADEVNATVSRAHAHIRLDRDTNEFRVFDDGSVHGTRVLRAGRSLAVPKRGSRGVRLQHGDEIELGSARLRFSTRSASRAPQEGSDPASPPKRARR